MDHGAGRDVNGDDLGLARSLTQTVPLATVHQGPVRNRTGSRALDLVGRRIDWVDRNRIEAEYPEVAVGKDGLIGRAATAGCEWVTAPVAGSRKAMTGRSA